MQINGCRRRFRSLAARRASGAAPRKRASKRWLLRRDHAGSAAAGSKIAPPVISSAWVAYSARPGAVRELEQRSSCSTQDANKARQAKVWDEARRVAGDERAGAVALQVQLTELRPDWTKIAFVWLRPRLDENHLHRGDTIGVIIAGKKLCGLAVATIEQLTYGRDASRFAPRLQGRWWLRIPSSNTKSHRVDQRQVPEFMTGAVNTYIKMHHPILCRGNVQQSALWLSSTTGRPLTAKILGALISKITRETLGVDVSPHLFRTAGASIAAAYGTKYPHLATALLNHRDPRITDKHYIRASSLSAAQSLTDIINAYRHTGNHGVGG